MRVNDDRTNADQTAPRIAVADDGRAVAVWIDRRLRGPFT